MSSELDDLLSGSSGSGPRGPFSGLGGGEMRTRILVVLGVLAVFALGGYGIYTWDSPTRDYKQVNLAPSNMVRGRNEKATAIDETHFPTKQLQSGAEIKFKLILKEDDGSFSENNEKVFTVPGWGAHNKTSQQTRNELVDAKKKELEGLVAWLNGPHPRNLRVKIVVDDTDGMDTKLSDFVHSRVLEESGIWKSLDLPDGKGGGGEGNGGTFRLYRLSGQNIASVEEVVVKAGEGLDKLNQKLHAKAGLLDERSETSGSSLWRNLQWVLNDQTDKTTWHTIIVSDGGENSSDTVQLPKNPPKDCSWADNLNSTTALKSGKDRIEWWYPPKNFTPTAELILGCWVSTLEQSGASSVKLLR